MKNQNNKVTAVLFVVALALAPMVQATPNPQGGPTAIGAAPTPRARPTPAPRPHDPVNLSANEGGGAESEAIPENLQVVTIHSTDNVIRGKTGSFVLQTRVNMKPDLLGGGIYANFHVGGTAVAGVDYKLLISPAYISPSGYAVIQIQTLPDPRGSAFRQAYSVVISLDAGAGYAVGKPSSATMWIKP